jgi:arylsulfatase
MRQRRWCDNRLLWLKELESYLTYPPLQAAETYNLGQVIAEIKKAHESHPSD